MAELNNTILTQEPVYLNYGSNQIDLQAFLDAAANNVLQYVNNLTWSAKRKLKFLNAYSDIMSKGIIGANNSTGQWAVDLNNNIDLDSMSTKDQEMYHEAAYYILQLMKGIAPREQQEEEKKSDLPVFNNDYFTELFLGYIGNQLFGGRDWDRNDDWNVLDEADKYGIRGTNNRAEKLADMLQGYRDSLKEEDLNFEGSPFTDLNDFKTKVNNAINQLRNKTWDLNDVDALNQIGINPETYMSTGANDMNPEGTMTRLLWKESLEKEEADKLAAELKDAQAKVLAQQLANAGVLTPINGINAVEAINQAPAYAEYLGRTYGVGQQGFNAINTAILGLIEKGYNSGKGGGLTNAEKKQLGNLLYYIRLNNPNYLKSNLSDLDWAELNLHKNLGSTNRAGYVRLPWQTSDGRYTYADDKGNIYFLKPLNKAKIAGPAFNRSAAYNDYKNNFLFNTKAGNGAAQSAYLNQEGAENAELYGIVADIASIIDPEPFSAMGLSLSAAGARNYAKLQQPGKWNWKDYGSLGLDYLTSVIGAIPVVGDAALASKVIKNLRRLGRFGAWSDIVQSTPGLVDIWNNKIMGDLKMTKQDWRTMGTALRGLVSHGRLNQSNLAARKVMQERGIETGNSWHLKSGFTSSAKQSNKTDVLKVTKNGKSEEIEITAKEKLDLEEAFKKVKPNERTAEARRILGKDKITDDVEVKVSSGVRSTVGNWNRFTRRTSDSFGTKSTPATRTTTKSDEEFENFLQGRSTLSKIGLGSNRYLRRIDRQLNLNSNPVSTSQKESIKLELKALPRKPYNKPTTSNQEVIPESRRLPQPGGEHRGTRIDVQRTGTSLTKNISTGEAVKEFTDFDRMYISSTRKNSKVPSRAFRNGYGTSKEPENGSLDFNGITATITKLDGDRGFTLAFGKTGDTVIAKLHKDVQQLRSDLARLLNKVIKKLHNVKETAALLRQFKAKGWLKQGGQINNFDLDKTISEFLNKLK